MNGIDPTDRGLAFGDGLFETLRYREGQPLWWPDHWSRLAEGCRRLRLPLPDEQTVHEGIASALKAVADAGEGRANGVLKLIYTAGPGGRGYRRPDPIQPTLRVITAALPAGLDQLAQDGVELGLSQQALMAGPTILTGLKHLNRLPQVLARAEWPASAEADFERLQRDPAGRVVGVTAGNFFWYEQGRWHTPPLGGAGIAGTVRARLIRHLEARITPLAHGRLALAESALITNAVWPVLPVRSLLGRVLDLGPAHAVIRSYAAWQKRHGQDRQPNPYTAWMAIWQQEQQNP